MSKHTEIIVTGATGNVGGLVVERLIERGVTPTVFVRDEAKARRRFGERVRVVVGDLGEPASLAPALSKDAALLLVSSGPKLAACDAAVARLAREAGVANLVKLSTMDVEAKSVGTGVWHAEGEAAIRASGAPFTFVRPSGFMSNALAWAPSIRAEGAVRSSTGDGTVAFVHPADIADVATAALVSSEHVGSALTISGPEALTYRAMVAIIAARIGKPITYESLTDEEQLARWSETGEPLSTYDYHLSIFRAIRAGKLSGVADGVQRVLGREPLTFARFIDAHAAAFTD